MEVKKKKRKRKRNIRARVTAINGLTRHFGCNNKDLTKILSLRERAIEKLDFYRVFGSKITPP